MRDKKQSGNIFLAIFGAVAMVGMIGAGVMTFSKGPVQGALNVIRKNNAAVEMSMAGQMAIMAAGPKVTTTVSCAGLGSARVTDPSNGHCYYLVSTWGYTWPQAKTVCEADGAHLATITSSGENALITSILSPTGHFWIGANDLASEGNWVWATGPEAGQQFWQGDKTGSAVNGRYANWDLWNGPNDPGGTKDYSALNTSAGGAWTDVEINGGGWILPICEKSPPNSADCDNDTYIEPPEMRMVSGGVAVPINGGLVPNTIGIAKRDPWGNEYGYCVWDHGPTILNTSCQGTPGTNKRLRGTNAKKYPVVALISAGADGVFTTTCRNFSAADVNNDGDLEDATDLPLVSKASSTDDDVIVSYNYEDALATSGGLWKLKSGDPTTAILNRNVEIANATIAGSGFFERMAAATGDFIDVVSGLKLADPAIATLCNNANRNVMRRMASGYGIEMCDGSSWISLSAAAGSGGTVTAILLDGATTWTPPADVTSVNVHIIGSGGRGNTHGGGSGAYIYKSNIPVTPGVAVPIDVTYGEDIWFKSATTAMAKAGTEGDATAGVGGSAASSFGDIKYSGASGGTSSTGNGGGAGSAGPNGPGQPGGAGSSTNGGGGGGSNGGSSSPGLANGTGGAGSAGTGGGIGGVGTTAGTIGINGGGGGGGSPSGTTSQNGKEGGCQIIWTDNSGGTNNGLAAGPCGGGGGGGPSGNGGYSPFGGGGGPGGGGVGDGGAGLIVVEYSAGSGGGGGGGGGAVTTIDGFADGVGSTTNLFAGLVSGSSNATGNYNTGLGTNALMNLTTGNGNSAMGFEALKNVTTSSYNTAMGWRAATSLTTGAGYNTAIGYEALMSCTVCAYNTAAGYQAAKMFNGTNGYNTALGSKAMMSNVTGQYNSVMGFEAGRSFTSGSNNQIIGYQAAQNASVLDGNIAIGYQALQSKYGILTENLAIGAMAMQGTGDSDAAAYNVAVGYQALKNVTTGSNNVAIGSQAGVNTATGSDCVALGFSAMPTCVTGNVGVGESSLLNNTSGIRNTAIGYEAGKALVSGSDNTVIGARSLQTYQGAYNTAYGAESLGGTNIAKTASRTVAMGYQAAYNGGNDIVAAGYQSLYNADNASYVSSTPPVTDSLLVFVTDTLHTGNLGGLAGADNICQTKAAAAGLPGTFKAWLSDTTTNAISRMSKRSGVPYTLVNGAVIANDWRSLVNNMMPLTAINRTQTNATVASSNVWTNTNNNGGKYDSSTSGTCGDWTVTTGSATTKGITSSSSYDWTHAGTARTCSSTSRLYCFQQYEFGGPGSGGNFTKIIGPDFSASDPTTITWVPPGGVTSVNVHVMGSGGRGGYGAVTSARHGGGGGAYAYKANIPVTPGVPVNIHVGLVYTDAAGETDTWFGSPSTVFAKGGARATPAGPGLGGTAAESIGDIKFSGGNGGSGGANLGGAGGGGAGGPNGNGKDGASPSSTIGAGGGGSDGGAATAGEVTGRGGANTTGAYTYPTYNEGGAGFIGDGGSGGGSSTQDGGSSYVGILMQGTWVDNAGDPATDNSSVGPNGGGGGAFAASGTNGGLSYGGGGGGGGVATGGTSLGYVVLEFSGVTGPASTGPSYVAGANTAVGYQSLYNLTIGANNTAIGYLAGQGLTKGNDNTLMGRDTASSTQPAETSNNVYFGFQSGMNSPSSNNVAMGYQTMSQTGATSDGSNVALGYQSLFKGSGSYNVCAGHSSCYNSTTGMGSGNVAIGRTALSAGSAANNVAIGLAAANKLTGSSNVVIGASALGNATSLVGGTAFGGSSFSANTAPTYGTAFGYNAVSGTTSATGLTAFGYQANQKAGNENTAFGYNALQGLANTQTNNTAFGYSAMSATTTTGSGNVSLRHTGAVAMTNNTIVHSAATISTGLSNSTVIGNGAGVTASNTMRFGNNTITSITAQVAYTFPSDRRLKKDIKPSDLGLDFIMKLKPVSYRLTDGNGRLDYGFLAQDIEWALDGRKTNMITRLNDKIRTYQMRSDDLIAPMVRAVQEQQQELKKLEKEFESIR